MGSWHLSTGKEPSEFIINSEPVATASPQLLVTSNLYMRLSPNLENFGHYFFRYFLHESLLRHLWLGMNFRTFGPPQALEILCTFLFTIFSLLQIELLPPYLQIQCVFPLQSQCSCLAQ